MKVLSKQFPRTSIAGEAGVRAAIFQLATPPLSIKCRNSALLAFSSESLVYRTEKAIQTFTPEGAIRGSIPVDPGIRYFNNVEVAGPRQLFFSTAGNDRITDLNGNLLARVHPPDGWGFRHGWSSDGSRLMFDQYVHHGTLGNRAVKAFSDALGSIFPEEANSESIRVIDVSTAGVCLSIESPGKLFGEAGGYHADLAPSGRLLAVSTLTELAIYRLPATCSRQ